MAPQIIRQVVKTKKITDSIFFSRILIPLSLRKLSLELLQVRSLLHFKFVIPHSIKPIGFTSNAGKQTTLPKGPKPPHISFTFPVLKPLDFSLT